MNNSIYIQISALVYCILLVVVYFNKKRYKTFENDIYKWLIVSNLVGLIIDIGLGIFSMNYPKYATITILLTKFYLVYFIIWITLFTYYVVVISKRANEKKNTLKFWLIGGLILSIFAYIFPVEIVTTETGAHSEGMGTSMVYIVSSIAIFICIFNMLRCLKKDNFKKYLPVFIFLFLGGMVMLIQMFNPTLILIPAMETVITFVMFFTIENPDMKLLEEVHKSKEISDAANEEKTLFLYNMTQEIRNTASEIDDNADMILESDSLDENKDCAREIKAITSKFNSMTNEMFDVSKMDAANVKVYNSKYNIKNILKEIVTMYTKSCKNKELDFRVNIDHDVPEVLYGDSIGLKDVLTTIMDNSVKYTSKGYIEFDVNTIIKNDVCRLIITIEDSGTGIKSEDINKMKIEDKSLSKANKLITLMNGTMIISSNYGFGTKVKVVLDQKIENNLHEDVVKYEEIYDNIKMLMVDDSDSGIKIIDKLIKGSNIKMDFATNGKECIDKIKAYDKYDIILLDEQLTQISAMELIKKIKSIRNFDIPVILLTKDNSCEYNDEYKKLGFNDYLLKPVKKEELLNKISQCVKKDQ